MEKEMNSQRIPDTDSIEQLSTFWDTHDLSEYWDQTTPVKFEVDIQSETTYYPVETTLSERISQIAKKNGVSAETLLNLWLQEKVREQAPAK